MAVRDDEGVGVRRAHHDRTIVRVHTHARTLTSVNPPDAAPDELTQAEDAPPDEIIQADTAPPDEAARVEVLKIHTKHMPLAADVRLDGIAAKCDGWSGAQLSALCREAGMGALRDGLRDDAGTPAVGQRHFERAQARVHAA